MSRGNQKRISNIDIRCLLSSWLLPQTMNASADGIISPWICYVQVTRTFGTWGLKDLQHKPVESTNIGDWWYLSGPVKLSIIDYFVYWSSFFWYLDNDMQMHPRVCVAYT